VAHPAIPALWRLRQEDYEFEGSSGNTKKKKERKKKLNIY
jgi:hypothetical protein